MTSSSTDANDPESESESEDAPRGAGQLLADRRFGPYVVGQWLSNTGNWFHNVAIGIVVFQATGSSTLVGLVGGLQYAFTLVLAPWAGQLSDRLDRRRLLVGAQLSGLGGAVGLAVLLAFVDPSPGLVWPIALFTCFIGAGYAIGLPTLQAYVPSLVPRRDLAQAIALNSVTFNLARAIGPALAGGLVAAAGAALAFGVNATTFAIFLGVLLWLGNQQGPASPSTATTETTEASPSVWAGLELARRDRAVAVPMLATVALGFATDPVLTLAPALADRLGAGAALVGGIGSAFGAGATASSLVVQPVRDRLGPRLQASTGLAVLAIGLSIGALATDALVLLPGMAVAGAGFLHATTTLNTTLQLHVDDHVRGRVMALWGMAFLGVRPIAAGLDGLVADRAGVTVAMFTAVGTAGVAALALLRETIQRPQ